MCERLNHILNLNVRKIVDDVGCPVTVALGWSVAAGNSLQNFNRFSSNQLVFGFNSAFSSIDSELPVVLEC